METWLIIVIVVVVALVALALILAAMRRRGPDDGQKRVEARARIAKAEEHQQTARDVAAKVEQDRETVSREREIAAQHNALADKAQERVQERSRIVDEHETAAAQQRDRARDIET